MSLIRACQGKVDQLVNQVWYLSQTSEWHRSAQHESKTCWLYILPPIANQTAERIYHRKGPDDEWRGGEKREVSFT